MPIFWDIWCLAWRWGLSRIARATLSKLSCSISAKEWLRVIWAGWSWNWLRRKTRISRATHLSTSASVIGVWIERKIRRLERSRSRRRRRRMARIYSFLFPNSTNWQSMSWNTKSRRSSSPQKSPKTASSLSKFKTTSKNKYFSPCPSTQPLSNWDRHWSGATKTPTRSNIRNSCR